jgi:hypothetical protein
MWRDPYGQSLSGRLLSGLLTMLAIAIGLQLLAGLVAPFIPIMFGAVVVCAGLMWLLQRVFRG